MNGLRRSTRIPNDPLNREIGARQARLTSQNATYRDALPAPKRALSRPVKHADPLAAYTRALAHDETISAGARRRAAR